MADAKDECRNLGGVLGVPSSDQENEFIVTLIPKDENVWLNCNDLDVEGNWKCREGKVEVAYRNWDAGQPDEYDEDCVAHFTLGNYNGWHDVDCNSKYVAVCKLAFRPVLRV